MGTEIVVPKRRTQKIDLEPCEYCGTTIWLCRRVTMKTPYPWQDRGMTVDRNYLATWPWVGGILVGCERCKRWWFANASLERFNDIRGALPEDGRVVRVQFHKKGKLVISADVIETPKRTFARPQRRHL
jgi:hypothetical protein